MSSPRPVPRTPRCYALVPCAGVGVRSGADRPKQYVPVFGQPMVAHTMQALRRVAELAATLVVLSPDDTLFEACVPAFDGSHTWVARTGGAQRADTVANGLATLSEHGADDDDWVLVHDAARCLVQPSWIQRLIDACRDDPVGGLLALPVADTLKQSAAGRSVATLSRVDKWAAQTPQMFRLGLLRDALHRAGTAVTDEASAIEALGLQPRLVEGDSRNIKVTWPADFAIAEALLRHDSFRESA